MKHSNSFLHHAKRIVFAFCFAILSVATAGKAFAYSFPTHTTNVNYGLPGNGAGYFNHDIHVTWEKEPADGWGMYAMYYFSFQAGVGGYIGIQKTVDPTRPKTVLFSVWDAPGKQSAMPAGGSCTRFGHEGSGSMCLMAFNWKAGTEYKLRVWRILNSQTNYSEKWGAWIIDVKTGEETMIGMVELYNINNQIGYGALNYNNLMTVTEYFAGPSSADCSNVPNFNVTWKGPYGNNGSANPTYAIGSYTTGIGTVCQQNNITTNGVFSTTQENGPSISRTTTDGKYLWSHYDLNKINKIDCVFNWAETRYGDVLKQPRLKRLSQTQFSQYYRDYRVDGKGSVIIADTLTDKVFKYDSGGVNTMIGDLSTVRATAGCGN